jgi:hypothetical protein
VGNTQCGEGESIFIPEGVLVYNVAVLSSEARPGCGYEGATVTFLLGGQQATRTGVWRSGSFQIMPFIAGHPFALFGGFVNTDRSLSNEVLVPYVGDKACGYTKWGDGGGYETAVYSNEQAPGCGTEGAQITFKLLDAQGNVIAVAQEKGIWHAWDGVAASQQLNLTMAPVGGPSIKIGNVGAGGSQQSGTLWREMSLVLAALGLGGVAAGAALRRRTATR